MTVDENALFTLFAVEAERIADSDEDEDVRRAQMAEVLDAAFGPREP